MPPDPQHFINLVDGRLKDTSPMDLAGLFAKAQTSNHLVVHFHGGLVGHDAAVSSGLDLMETYQDAGAHPVFFIWNSDLPSVIKGSWDEIPKEKAFQRLVKRLAQLAIGKLQAAQGRRGGALQLPSMREIPSELGQLSAFLRVQEPTLDRNTDDLTPEQEEQATRELDSDPVIIEATTEIALGEQQAQNLPMTAVRRGTAASRPQSTLMTNGVREDIRRDIYPTPGEPVRRGVLLLTLARHGAAILFNVVRRYITHRDHGLYTTIVEEVMRRLYVDSLGQLAWDMMKRDTLDAFGSDANCGGTAFLRHLAEWHEDGRRITLVGHSTGAVYIGNFLQAADRALSADIGFEVVFLAPACSFDFMYSRLPVFQRRVGTRIRSFGLSDERERGYFEVPILYAGSLLYMVSGMFEMTEVDKEIVGMQRFYRTEHPYDGIDCEAVRQYLQDKTVWSQCASPDGWRSDAPRHGGFTADLWTKDSLAYIVRNGI